MKFSKFSLKSLLRELILAAFVCGNFIPTHSAHAAGPCSPFYTHSGNITSDETWCATGDFIHYLTGDVIVQAGVTLTIEAGVTVDSGEASWSKYLIVQGHLDVLGTEDHPVLMTRSINYPSQNWGGLFFDGSLGDGSGIINYATITHAGANFLPPGCTGTCGTGQTAVFVKDLAAGNQVSIQHSNITDNTSKGLYVVDSTVQLAHNAFSQNKYPIHIVGSTSAVTYLDNTFSNNAYPYYDVGNYTIQEDSIFLEPGALMGQDFSLPLQDGLDAYVFLSGTTIPLGTTMTVQPGVTLRMAAGKYLNVNGHLDAVGTKLQPIRFSGIPNFTQSDSLYWGGLYFDGTAGDGGGTISYAIIERGGANELPPGCSGTCGSAQTALFVKDVPASKPLNIRYSTIRGSLSKSLFVVNSAGLRFDSNLIMGGKYGADLVTNITVSNLVLMNQELDGLIVEAGFTVDARHLTITNAGRSGLHVASGGVGLLRNSILSHNTLAVWAEGSGQANLNTNLADANTTFRSGAGTERFTILAPATFEADGYHIQTTSKAVGMGIPGLSAVDIDGEGRPDPSDTRPDIGADEIPVGIYHNYIPFMLR